MHFPIMRQSHILQRDVRIFRKQAFYSPAPLACRCDQSQHVTTNHQDYPTAVVLQFAVSMPCWKFVLLWKIRLITQFAIPKAGMVGAYVARSIETPEP